MKKCPYCAEVIQEEAIKCKHCGEMLKTKLMNICPKCSKTYDDTWKVCLDCRVPLKNRETEIRDEDKVALTCPDNEQKMGKGLRWLIGLIITAVTVAVIVYVANNIDTVNRRVSSSGDDISAYVAATEYIRQNINTPSTIKFPLILDASVTNLGDNRYQVSSYYDAQNDYGAQVRKHYECIIKHVGGEGDVWRMEKFE